MIKFATFAAATSIVALGAFWPTISINFERSFVRRFLLPAFLIAVVDCFVLSYSIGWWTALAYLVLMFIGTRISGSLLNGKHLKTLVFEGGVWFIGIFALVLGVIAFLLWRL
jgi:hypothetical protein